MNIQPPLRECHPLTRVTMPSLSFFSLSLSLSLSFLSSFYHHRQRSCVMVNGNGRRCYKYRWLHSEERMKKRKRKNESEILSAAIAWTAIALSIRWRRLAPHNVILDEYRGKWETKNFVLVASERQKREKERERERERENEFIWQTGPR